jgi:serine/threonine protein kinase/tetratricopeptide (TPR) repeat protein
VSDDAGRLRRVRELFDAVLDTPTSDRAAFLARAAGSDAGLRREVEELVTASAATGALDRAPFAGEAAVPARESSQLVGQRLGPYTVSALIGTGGMGAVYEAVRADDQYRKRVAIKLVSVGADSDLTQARFRRERQILANLEHRNIATLLDGGVAADGRPFLVMEYVEGEPITTYCNGRSLSVRRRLALFRQVCAAVQHAHTNLVVHRDLKPGNILVTGDGTVKLLDFGIAKLVGDDERRQETDVPLTRGGVRAFTPEYASPEQISGAPLTTASDVYSLGVVLYELLAGRRPHVVSSSALVDIERAVLEDPVVQPSTAASADAARACGERSVDRLRRRLRGELDNIVLTALRREPERRYASVEALADDVQRFLTGRPIRAQRDWAGYRLQKFVQRNAGTVAASALVFVALVGGAIATSVEARRARAEQSKSERVSGFLRSILGSVRPATGGRDVPVSEVLDSAARRVETELTTQPEVQLELQSVIGDSYKTLGRYAEAERQLREALALRERVSGPRSMSTVAGLTNLAGVLLDKGELSLADSVLRQALALHRSLTSNPDTLLATIFSDLGSVAHNRGQHAESEQLHRESLTLKRGLYGEHSDAVARSMLNVSVALGDQGKWAAAESLNIAALDILRANHPEPNVLVAAALNSLAGALDLQGKNDAADSAYHQTLALRKQLLGEDHPDYASTAYNYSMFAFDRGRYDEAADYSRKILALRGKTLPESHPSVAAALQTLGRCLDKLGDTAGGQKALEESLALRQKYLPAGSWPLASSESVLGEHFVLTKDYPRAERLLTHADDVLMKTFGAQSQRTVNNRRRLLALYEASGHPDKAAAVRAQLPQTPP